MSSADYQTVRLLRLRLCGSEVIEDHFSCRIRFRLPCPAFEFKDNCSQRDDRVIPGFAVSYIPGAGRATVVGRGFENYVARRGLMTNAPVLIVCRIVRS